jgi:hypothetical protein
LLYYVANLLAELAGYREIPLFLHVIGDSVQLN